VQGVPVPIEPTHQPARVRRQLAASPALALAVPAAAPAAFGVALLALAPQRLPNLFAAAALQLRAPAVPVLASPPDHLAPAAAPSLVPPPVPATPVDRRGLGARDAANRPWGAAPGLLHAAPSEAPASVA
ncbi:hypothetical protein B1218_37680, partial [Pseudomonas ogarae]